MEVREWRNGREAMLFWCTWGRDYVRLVGIQL